MLLMGQGTLQSFPSSGAFLFGGFTVLGDLIIGVLIIRGSYYMGGPCLGSLIS